MAGWLVVLAILVIAGYLVVTYNNLVSQRQLSQDAWSGIEGQLKRRAGLVPDLLDAVAGPMADERDTLGAVSIARAAAEAGAGAAPEQRARLEGRLSGALDRLLAAAEAYPDLKASTTVPGLQGALQKAEDELQLAGRYYNGTARNLNTAVQSFPSSILAAIFHVTAVQYFEIDNSADRAAPDAT